MKPVYFVILGVVLGLVGFFLILANPFGLKVPRPNLEGQKTGTDSKAHPGTIAAPTPTLILPSGKQTFFVRGGDQDFSKLTQVVVDPLDATKGTQQTIDISVNSSEPITDFKITLKTDSATNTYTPTVKSGNSTLGVWSATYSFPDTALTSYSFTFEMTTQTNKKTIKPFLLR